MYRMELAMKKIECPKNIPKSSSINSSKIKINFNLIMQIFKIEKGVD